MTLFDSEDSLDWELFVIDSEDSLDFVTLTEALDFVTDVDELQMELPLTLKLISLTASETDKEELSEDLLADSLDFVTDFEELESELFVTDSDDSLDSELLV